MGETKNKQNKKERLFEKLLSDRKVRKAIVTQRFDFFFPVYFHKRLEFETPPFHEEIFKILEDSNISLAVILAFRGSAKSTLVSIAYVLWAIFGVQQKKFVILIGQTEQKARAYLMNIRRQLENNELLRKDLGPFDEEKGPWGATALTIRKMNAKIMIASVGQSIRGVLHDEYRPDLIILDDVEDIESVKNQESRDKLFDWFTGEVIPAGSRKTRIIAIGNLLHENGLLRRLQKSIEQGRPNSIYREYPIVDENGNPLWPGKYPTPEDIEKERMNTINHVAWAREYLLKIVPTEGQIIPREWIKTYKELPPENSASYYYATAVDLAIKQHDQADFTAMVSAKIYGRKENLQIYILPNPVNKRLSSLETIETAKKISYSLNNSKIYIEDVQYQYSIVEQLIKENCPAEGVKVHGQDKAARLSAVSFPVQAGKVRFPEVGAEALVNQLVGFGVESHDDLADAFSMLLSKILENDRRNHIVSMRFKGEYDGEFDHLPPDEREKMLRARERLRKMFLV